MRPLCPGDFDEVKAAHSRLFPIDYDDSFFLKATKGLDRIFSWGAFAAPQPQQPPSASPATAGAAANGWHPASGGSSGAGGSTARGSGAGACAPYGPTATAVGSSSSSSGSSSGGGGTGNGGSERLVGFVTARVVRLHECETRDRQLMGLLSMTADHDCVVYILTLGVVERWRGRGVALQLIDLVTRYAAETRCRAAFLHVITYNAAAIQLYARAGFTCAGLLPRFYFIATGRQPDPGTCLYDAHLFVRHTAPPDGWGTPWDVVALAVSPLRAAWGRLGRMYGCMPQLWPQPPPHHRRQQQQRLERGGSSEEIELLQQLPPVPTVAHGGRDVPSSSSSGGSGAGDPQLPGWQLGGWQQQWQRQGQLQRAPYGLAAWESQQQQQQQQQPHHYHHHNYHHQQQQHYQQQHQQMQHYQHQQQLFAPPHGPNQPPAPQTQQMLRWLFDPQRRAQAATLAGPYQPPGASPMQLKPQANGRGAAQHGAADGGLAMRRSAPPTDSAAA